MFFNLFVNPVSGLFDLVFKIFLLLLSNPWHVFTNEVGLVTRLVERLNQWRDALLSLHMFVFTLIERRLLFGKLVAPLLIRCVVDLGTVVVKPLLSVI